MMIIMTTMMKVVGVIDNNKNRTDKCNSRFFTISSLRRELSPPRTL